MTTVGGVPENYFDVWIAENYAVIWPHLFDPDVVEPAVNLMAGLAGDGRPWNSASALVASPCR